MKTIIECPLGSKCEKRIDDNTIERCAWYTKIVGTNPQTGQEVDEWACTMAWIPILLIENSRQSRSQAAATESMRNEVVKRQDFLNSFLENAQHRVRAIE